MLNIYKIIEFNRTANRKVNQLIKMQQQPVSFTLSTQQLYFTQFQQTIKIWIKNISLKTTSYQIIICDQEHFKIISATTTTVRSFAPQQPTQEGMVNRTFCLAPGMTKNLTIRHINSIHCKNPDRHVLKGRIRDSFGKWIPFQCRCPAYQVNIQKQIVKYNKVIKLGQFDQKVSFYVDIVNVSPKNIKIVFSQRFVGALSNNNNSVNNSACNNNIITNSTRNNKNNYLDNISSKGEANRKSNNLSVNGGSQKNIIVMDVSRKLTIKNLSIDSIIMAGQNLKFQFELFIEQHGQLNQILQFAVIQQQSTFASNIKQQQKHWHKNKNYSIDIQGYSVSKKLLIKDQNMQAINQVRNQLLNGTSKASCFYLQTQYHQDIPYTLEAYFQLDKPQLYGLKWQHLAIEFRSGTEDGGNAHKPMNRCQGVLKTKQMNKIQYKIYTKYTQNDQNYVSKYSKIQFQDDSNALRMRNSQYSKKYEDLQVKVLVKMYDYKPKHIRSKVESTNKIKTQKSLGGNSLVGMNNLNSIVGTNKQIGSNIKYQRQECQIQTIIPFKFTIINPSLRCQINEIAQQTQNQRLDSRNKNTKQEEVNSHSTNIVIFNETKINIPYCFPLHSLYRVIQGNNNANINSSNTKSQSIQSFLQANKKQHITIKWTKNKERCPIYMQIPGFDLVLYQTKSRVRYLEKSFKQTNILCLPPTRKRPQTSISSNIGAKQKEININYEQTFNNNGIINQNILKRMNSQGSLFLNNVLSRPNSGFSTSKTNYKTARNVSSSRPADRPQTPGAKFNNCKSLSSKKLSIIKQLPSELIASLNSRNAYENLIPSIQQLSYLTQIDKIIKNTHPNKNFILQIIGLGFLIIKPHQFYIFDNEVYNSNQDQGYNNLLNMHGADIRYRVYGHSPTYRIKMSQEIENIQPGSNSKRQNTTQDKQFSGQASLSRTCNLLPTFYQPSAYQILTRQIKMSFKNISQKQQFQIVEPILIKNCSNSNPLQVNCISIDGQFFKCKENNGVLIVNPGEIGKFRIGFIPENSIRLSVMNRQAPRELRRKAIVKSDNEVSIKQNSTVIKKQIKLLINKQVQVIICQGQIVEKSCSIKPYSVSLTNCKYGSPQIVQTLIITNTSKYKINYIIQFPPQITIKPKAGSILSKCTQNCTITFKPSKKISNFSDNIKIYIGGSHLQLVPLFINVEDPQIYIKQSELFPYENAICGTQIQQLNLQMTIINNNPSQSFIQLNLHGTPLYLGYTKNYHSPNSGIVMQNFIRCSQIIEDNKKFTTMKKINENKVQHKNQYTNMNNSLKTILSEDSHLSNTILPAMQPEQQRQKLHQLCSINIVPNSFLIIPLTLRLCNSDDMKMKIGQNIIKLNNNIATLVGFGEIKSPTSIKFNCNKTLLHISPYKVFNEIILTQNQKSHQLCLSNLAQKTVRVWTKVRQLKVVHCLKKSQYENKQQQLKIKAQERLQEKEKPEVEPTIICTFKDIDQHLKPQQSINLNMSFLCFDAEKHTVKAQYELAIFVKQFDQVKESQQQNISENQQQQFLPTETKTSKNIKTCVSIMPYFTATINVIVPQPFLEICPSVLVMPTVAMNYWSRQSFFIRNNGYKQIFIKIKKPTNIAFELQYQIINSGCQSNGNHKIRSKKNTSSSSINRPSLLDQKSKEIDNKKTVKILQNQLTKMNNVIQVKISFRSKTKISFKCIVEIQDNFNKKYEMSIVGTCTDSPFFIMDGNTNIGNSMISANSFNSHASLCSQKSFASSLENKNNKFQSNINALRKSCLEPSDIQDLLFLNNWIGSLIPQISNQSTFFYVWLTKIENFIKFLNQFNITLSLRKSVQINNKNRNSLSQKDKLEKDRQLQKFNLTVIFQDLKQKGFQLSSLRIQLLQKADQLQWLNFMWFFLSKAIIYPGFLAWITKHTTNSSTQMQQISYSYVQKNYQQILTILFTSLLNIKKQSNNNKSIDWKYLLQNFQPLLQNFKHIQSRRHLILGLNLLYHKFSSAINQIVEISDFQFVLHIKNNHTRRVRYFLQCNPKFITCQQSSNKILPAETLHGYIFVAQQNEQFDITFSLRNYTINAITVITKSILDICDIIMYNNIIWDPITIFHIKLKRKQDIIHHVNIQCQNKSSQEWVYKFEAKISAQYRIFFEVESDQTVIGSQHIKLISGQPGFLKKGQSTTIRVIYSPQNMNKCEAVLKIVNTMLKQVFKIHGVPLHSSKMQYEKNLKIIQNQTHVQTIIIPWQNLLMKSQLPEKIVVNQKNTLRSSEIVHSKQATSVSSRNQNVGNVGNQATSVSSRNQNVGNVGNKGKQVLSSPVNTANTFSNYQLKLYNPNEIHGQQGSNKYLECITSKKFQYNVIKRQLAITLTFKYELPIRNLQLIFQVTNEQNPNVCLESKLIRLVVDVVPKPVLIQAQIQSQYNNFIVQQLKIPNIAKLAESLSLQYGFLPPTLFVKQKQGGKQQKNPQIDTRKILSAIQNCSSINQGVLSTSMLQNIHKGLFEIIKYKNKDMINLFNKQHKILDYIDLGLKYYPNQNNCYFYVNSAQANERNSEQHSTKLSKSKNISRVNSKQGNNSNINNNSCLQESRKVGGSTNQLPYFYITLTYSQSLCQVTYLFKPHVKKPNSGNNRGNKLNCLLSQTYLQNKRTIQHQCQPLKKYSNNYIQLQNPYDFDLVYEVQTDLYEVCGNNQIKIKPRSTGKYYYELYCLHLGTKAGKIKFKQINTSNQDNKYGESIEYNVSIKIEQSAKSPSIFGSPLSGINGQNPDLIEARLKNINQQQLKIYNQYFQISSCVRKQKVFSISLANFSDKEIQYQIKCNSEYLHPRVQSNVGSDGCRYIRIGKRSQYELQIQYVPYFIGRKQAKLHLYNPHQPEITYTIFMVSEQAIETIVREMSKIGQNKVIQICVDKPVKDNTQKKDKTRQDIEVDLELIQMSLNGKLIQEKDYIHHIKIQQQLLQPSRGKADIVNSSQSQNPAQILANINSGQQHKEKQKQRNQSSYKFKLHYQGSSGGDKKGNGHQYRKLYVLFMTDQLLDKYQYVLKFSSARYGQYVYNISYKYPFIQKMDQITLQVNTQDACSMQTNSKINQQNNMVNSSKVIKEIKSNTNSADKNNRDLDICIPFINRFNENIQLNYKCVSKNNNISIRSIAIINSEIKTDIGTESKDKNKKLVIPAYTKVEIRLVLQSKKNGYNERFRTMINGLSQLQIELQEKKLEKFMWIYPLTIYQVFQVPNRSPILITGQARMPILAKIYPLVAYKVAKVQAYLTRTDKDKDRDKNSENKQKNIQQFNQQTQLLVKVKQDVIRKRVVTTNKNNQLTNKQSKQIDNSQRKQAQNTAKILAYNNYIQNISSVDRILPNHKYLSSEYLYQVQIQLNVMSALKNQGFLYVYQNSSHIQSRNISPNLSQKDLFNKSSFKPQPQEINRVDNIIGNKEELGYFIQKIPFLLKIQPAKIELLQFEANVGEKATIKLKLDNIINQSGNKNKLGGTVGSGKKISSNIPKVLDYIMGSIQNQVKIQLHNNKCRQFSAFYNQKQSCIQVTYFAQEYSGLKKGRLQITVGKAYSQYQLLGKFPKNSERNQRVSILNKNNNRVDIYTRSQRDTSH